MICPICKTEYNGNFCPKGCNSPYVKKGKQKLGFVIAFTIISIIVFIVSFIISMIILAVINSESDSIIIDTPIEIILFFAPFSVPLIMACIGVYLRNKKFPELNHSNLYNSNNTNPKISTNRKKRERMAADLYLQLRRYADIAVRSESAEEFVKNWDNMMATLSHLCLYEGHVKCLNGSPNRDLQNKRWEFQDHLHDAIQRSKDHAIKNIKQFYNPINKIDVYKQFLEDMLAIHNRCDEANEEFLSRMVLEVKTVAGVIDEEGPEQENAPVDTNLPTSFNSIDNMEGHEFEFWCASLLNACGFNNVNLTKSSGDQGVDILAEKSGIKYAIQCKCYSSDLGNKPIQEVHAGKSVYNCHVGVVMTNRHFTKGGKELAETTGTLLWDRDKLKEFYQTSIINQQEEITIPDNTNV